MYPVCVKRLTPEAAGLDGPASGPPEVGVASGNNAGNTSGNNLGNDSGANSGVTENNSGVTENNSGEGEDVEADIPRDGLATLSTLLRALTALSGNIQVQSRFVNNPHANSP